MLSTDVYFMYYQSVQYGDYTTNVVIVYFLPLVALVIKCLFMRKWVKKYCITVAVKVPNISLNNHKSCIKFCVKQHLDNHHRAK
jgi:hypothetical protein